MAKRNFLLGKGERLAEDIRVIMGGAGKVDPYTFSEAKTRLTPMVASVATEVDKLPADACPDDLAVATITLNPEFIAKSYYPAELLRSVGLETVGSRSRQITPEKKSKGREPEETFTTELFVKGKRSSFKRWANTIANLSEMEPGADQLTAIEEVSFISPEQKLKITDEEGKKLFSK